MLVNGKEISKVVKIVESSTNISVKNTRSVIRKANVQFILPKNKKL